jgi:hypothetical protein
MHNDKFRPDLAYVEARDVFHVVPFGITLRQTGELSSCWQIAAVFLSMPHIFQLESHKTQNCRLLKIFLVSGSRLGLLLGRYGWSVEIMRIKFNIGNRLKILDQFEPHI